MSTTVRVSVHDDEAEQQQHDSSSILDDIFDFAVSHTVAHVFYLVQFTLLVAILLVCADTASSVRSRSWLVDLLTAGGSEIIVVTGDDNSNTDSSSSNSNNRALGRKLGQTALGMLGTTGGVTGLLFGNIPGFLARIVTADFPTAAVSVGRAATFLEQMLLPDRTPKVTFQQKQNWVQSNCNLTEPQFNQQQCQWNPDACYPCCYSNWANLPPYAKQNPSPYPYWNWICTTRTSRSWYDTIAGGASMVKSVTANVYFLKPPQLPEALANSPSALAPFALENLISFAGAQGNLSAANLLSNLPCHEMVKALDALHLAGQWVDASGVTRTYNVTNTLHDITNAMKKVCEKGELLPTKYTNPPMQMEEERVASVQEDNHKKQQHHHHHDHHNGPMGIALFGVGIVVTIAVFYLAFKKLRSSSSSSCCCSDAVTPTSAQQQQQSDDTDIVSELFRPRNLAIIVLNFLLVIIIVGIFGAAAAQYKQVQRFVDVEAAMHNVQENPKPVGERLGSALFHLASTEDSFMGIPSKLPALAQAFMQLDLPQLAWNSFKFSSLLQGELVKLCRGPKPLAACNSTRFGDFSKGAATAAGYVRGSVLPAIFGEYSGKNPGAGIVGPHDPLPFDPVALTRWFGKQLDQNGAYLELFNSNSCPQFVASLKSFAANAKGQWVTPSNSRTDWNATGTLDKIADGIWYICTGSASADAMPTTTAAPVTAAPGAATTTTTTLPPGATTTAAPAVPQPKTVIYTLVFSATSPLPTAAQLAVKLQKLLTANNVSRATDISVKVLTTNNKTHSVSFELVAAAGLQADSPEVAAALVSAQTVLATLPASSVASSFGAASFSSKTEAGGGGDGGSSIGPAVGGAIGGVAVLALVAFLIYRHHKGASRSSETTTHENFSSGIAEQLRVSNATLAGADGGAATTGSQYGSTSGGQQQYAQSDAL